MDRFIQLFFAIPAPVALGAVFLLTCAEASLFFGFVIPGEIAVVLGGVLASRGSVPLGGVIAAAVGGAILGDFFGFSIGRRYGTALLERRFPRRWPPVRAWIDRRGAPAVFFGRSTAFLRAVVPTAAGAARMSPWRFLLWNVLGGVAWGTAFSLVGYFAGEGYKAALRWAGRGSIALTILVVALFGAYLVKRWLDRRLTGPDKNPP
jgi:membrane-associated protein